MLSELEKKLQNVEVSDGPTFAFVPKVHVHSDMNKWFCSIFHAMSVQDSAQVRSLSNALRKAIWDVVQEVEPVPNVKEQTFGSDQADALVRKMVRIMKLRVVSYERTVRRVVKYTRAMISKSRKIAQALMHKQDELSRHIRSSAMAIKQEKIGQLPAHVETSIMIDDPTFGPAFQVNTEANSKQQLLDQLKQKASKIYKKLEQLQQERVHAILQHDKAKVKLIDEQIKKMKTQTRALMGARQYMTSMLDDVENISLTDTLNETIEDAFGRLEAGIVDQKVLDYDLYRREIEHQIDEHSNGMALFLGLQTQQEIAALRKDMIKEVCKHVSHIFEEGSQEVMLLNQEMGTYYRELVSNKDAIVVIKSFAKRYRASIAKIQIMLLGLFDKRT